jgi:hypothetical protein
VSTLHPNVGILRISTNYWTVVKFLSSQSFTVSFVSLSLAYDQRSCSQRTGLHWRQSTVHVMLQFLFITELLNWSMLTLTSPIIAEVSLPVVSHCFYLARQAPVGQGLLVHEVPRPHTTMQHGGTPLDERSAHRRDLYLTSHNTHNRQTYTAGSEPVIPTSEQP